MEKHFCNYEISLALKELGFDEECSAIYCNGEFWLDFVFGKNPKCRFKNSNLLEDDIVAPLIFQAIEWLLKELDFGYPLLKFNIYSDYSGGWDDDTGCLKPFVNLNEALLKGIELCKKQK